MIALVLVVGVVCFAAGAFTAWMAPTWLQPDPYDQLADRDRKRLA